MKKQFTMYTLICDNCGCDLCASTDYSCVDEEMLDDDADCSGWLIIDAIEDTPEKHYCPDCWEADENGNNIPITDEN